MSPNYVRTNDSVNTNPLGLWNDLPQLTIYVLPLRLAFKNLDIDDVSSCADKI